METAPTTYVVELSCEIDALTARMALSDLGELLSSVGKSPHTKVTLVSIEGYDRTDGIDNPHPVKSVAATVDAIYGGATPAIDNDDNWGPFAKSTGGGDAHFHGSFDSPCYAEHRFSTDARPDR